MKVESFKDFFVRYSDVVSHSLFQASFKFSWNVDNGHCNVIDSEPLTETGFGGAGGGGGGGAGTGGGGPDHLWHPARNASLALQRAWGITARPTGVKFFTNDAVISGTSLKTIVDSEHLLAIIQDELA